MKKILDDKKLLISFILLIVIALIVIGGIIYIIRYNINNSKEKVVEGTNFQDVYIQTDLLNEISMAEYDQIAKENGLFLLLVSKASCPACNEFEPILNQALKDQGLTAYKFDLDKFSDDDFKTFDKKFKIEGTPTLFIIKDKKVLETLSGLRDLNTTIMWLRAYYE